MSKKEIVKLLRKHLYIKRHGDKVARVEPRHD